MSNEKSHTIHNITPYPYRICSVFKELLVICFPFAAVVVVVLALRCDPQVNYVYGVHVECN